MSEAYFKYVLTVMEATVIGIGLIGNLLSIIVFSRKTFRNNSISTYCIALAIVECLSLIQLINHIVYFISGANFMDLNETFCKIGHNAVNLIGSIQPFIMVAFSIDKLLSMRTKSTAITKKKWFQWSVVAAIAIFHIGLNLYYPILVKLREVFPGYFICDATSIGFFTIHMILSLIDTSLVPFVILMITSILTIRMLFKSSNSIERNGKLTKERKSRDRKYAITSVTLNIMFIFLKLPLTIFYILFAFYSFYNIYYLKVATLLFFLNASSGFFVYVVTNSLFRKEFLVLFRLVKGNDESSGKTNVTIRPIRINQVSAM